VIPVGMRSMGTVRADQPIHAASACVVSVVAASDFASFVAQVIASSIASLPTKALNGMSSADDLAITTTTV
jgi:hypothetical protein